jgi:hypothetical protein
MINNKNQEIEGNLYEKKFNDLAIFGGTPTFIECHGSQIFLSWLP